MCSSFEQEATEETEVACADQRSFAVHFPDGPGSIPWLANARGTTAKYAKHAKATRAYIDYVFSRILRFSRLIPTS